MKYIVGLDRANLSEEHPAYKIAIANTHGKIVGTCSHASRRLLKDIINHPTLLEPAVWSYSEFNMIMDLTSRKFLILQDIFIENRAISQEKKKVTPLYAFNRAARSLKFHNRISEDQFNRYDLLPEFEPYYNDKGKIDPYLSRLCLNTLILSKINWKEIFENSFRRR